MAGRFFNPYPQFFNSTPAVYSSGVLRFYASGTSTPLSVYSNEGLSSGAATSITLNSAGRAAVDIFLQDLEYKVTLEDSSGNIIWTADPVSSRDSSYVAKTLTGSGSPNGSVAGTAGSSSVLPDFYWDYTNSILYVCTTTGTTLTAVWTAVNASAATPAVPPPQGRLTMTSGTPIISSSVTGGSSVYYTPYNGNLIPIYNGASMVPTEFSELTLSLVASHASGSIYDVFVFSNAGVMTLVTGPAWAIATAGSGSRGSGAGTTQIARVKGVWTNAVSMTARNGSTTYTVGANLGTYVGSIYVNDGIGQVTCHVASGQSRKWGVWNAYNRVPIVVKMTDATASWSYNSATVRQSQASASNTLATFCGLAEEYAELGFNQLISSLTNASTSGVKVGIGVNSTTTISGFAGNQALSNAAASNITLQTTLRAYHAIAPSLGVNNVNSLESSQNGTTNNTYYGGEDQMLLTAVWRG
jgi:hypothetical protein